MMFGYKHADSVVVHSFPSDESKIIRRRREQSRSNAILAMMAEYGNYAGDGVSPQVNSAMRSHVSWVAPQRSGDQTTQQ